MGLRAAIDGCERCPEDVQLRFPGVRCSLVDPPKVSQLDLHLLFSDSAI